MHRGEQLIKELNDQLPEFLKHIYNIPSQYKSIKLLKENLKKDECLIHMDFSENYSCKYSMEVQSMHFGASRPQVTLHTVVIYTRDQKNDAVTSIPICTISSNSNDACAVWAHRLRVLSSLIG